MDPNDLTNEIANKVSVAWRKRESKTLLGAYGLVMKRNYPHLAEDHGLFKAVMSNLARRKRRAKARAIKQSAPPTLDRHSKRRQTARTALAQLLKRPYEQLRREALANADERHDDLVRDP